ncbi:hypothetical protein EO95_01555 [Methanosarcina sp. 1.H.T.1A.1]|uniref:hypothetical protein n=1 Tax=Methanosarcina sp. 1.H.T.1A.1 TaxID=1483602 RepID=UPI0006224DC0|nr:hypothetical protein [Methanosarcina sp. 1.H.T.1A.1]KKH93343.1 hypothetical protein EO95_01555 [Methanosarcina sp. 1.H.T.1A.1]
MAIIEAVKNFFIKGRGVLLGFPLIFLGAVLFTVHKILGLVTVTIGIVFLTMSDYVIENEEESEDEVIGRELPGAKIDENEIGGDNRQE